jgi:hypothetical protein
MTASSIKVSVLGLLLFVTSAGIGTTGIEALIENEQLTLLRPMNVLSVSSTRHDPRYASTARTLPDTIRGPQGRAVSDDPPDRGRQATVPAAKAKRRPNIVWIVGENLKLDFGCYGAKHVKTPNLDGLAANGMRYTKVFSTSPVCAPSRSAFFVGMYQTTSDTHNMRSHRNDGYRLPEGVRPITHRLKDVSYFTGNIKTMSGEVVGSAKLDLNFVKEGRLYDTDKWEDLAKNQPFFAQINTLEAEYDIYDRQTWRQPRVEWKGERDHETIAKPADVTPPPYYPDHPVVRQEWAS